MDLYTDSQVPAPSASAWLVDMSEFGGPCFVVLRTSRCDARTATVSHLIEIGFGLDRAKVESLVSRAAVTEAAVIW